MTWEETIKYIRQKPKYALLVEKAYFDEDLELNLSRFNNSKEYFETKKIIKKYAPTAQSLLDIGCGNGISAINFAKDGYKVTAVEPDSSTTIGAGAIKILKEKYDLSNVNIFEDYAENISFQDNIFDIVYIRQAMHHAKDLNSFIKEAVRVLKPNGLLLTVRDHVIYDQKDKEWFLNSHPLQKFYGGENAFKASEYKKAITNAGALIIKELKYYDSVINYFPSTWEILKKEKTIRIQKQKQKLKKRIGLLSKLPFMWQVYCLKSDFKPLDEKNVPGRMYSYIAIKK